jgi:hypothetical protein
MSNKECPMMKFSFDIHYSLFDILRFKKTLKYSVLQMQEISSQNETQKEKLMDPRARAMPTQGVFGRCQRVWPAVRFRTTGGSP